MLTLSQLSRGNCVPKNRACTISQTEFFGSLCRFSEMVVDCSLVIQTFRSRDASTLVLMRECINDLWLARERDFRDFSCLSPVNENRA
jgi:hypothetical protein